MATVHGVDCCAGDVLAFYRVTSDDRHRRLRGHGPGGHVGRTGRDNLRRRIRLDPARPASRRLLGRRVACDRTAAASRARPAASAPRRSPSGRSTTSRSTPISRPASRAPSGPRPRRRLACTVRHGAESPRALRLRAAGHDGRGWMRLRTRGHRPGRSVTRRAGGASGSRGDHHFGTGEHFTRDDQRGTGAAYGDAPGWRDAAQTRRRRSKGHQDHTETRPAPSRRYLHPRGSSARWPNRSWRSG